MGVLNTHSQWWLTKLPGITGGKWGWGYGGSGTVDRPAWRYEISIPYLETHN